MGKQAEITAHGTLKVGSRVPERTLTAVTAPGAEPRAAVPVPDPDRLVHLQFRRFAGCPVCNLHLQSIVRRHDEITAAGIAEVVVFHSPAEELRGHIAHLPFPVIGDPDRRLYREFGVEATPKSLLRPQAWIPIVRSVIRGIPLVLRGKERLPARQPHGGRTGLPADFLIAPDGRITAAKLGTHVYDQWSVDELLSAAAAARSAEAHPAAVE
ncbi:peroxiredoxin-like family protein [Yinghuangia soli]|uniref:AhpC/TSA family protein n=1 Tax=Yinghuangia soli TaxID=2908204 RepID=A0AA41TYF8_9ACTN|nr:peroxiredoxin-like family protein [Yinghuangia soli]MCF2526351.1 AhpC/TSA family protein [Yinghuangia soli]